MYPWADPEKLLDERSLDQIIMFYRRGWEARETEAWLFWGVLGEILDGGEKKKKPSKEELAAQGVKGLEQFREAHPEAKNDGGAWRVSR